MGIVPKEVLSGLPSSGKEDQEDSLSEYMRKVWRLISTAKHCNGQ